MAGARLSFADWRASVADLVVERAAAWNLRVGQPYPGGEAGHVVRAELADGTPAVLKLVYPHREAEHEADALEVWDGDGAVRLYARSDDGWAMLLERCEPGTLIADSLDGDAALDVIAELLPRLWKPAAAPFRSLADEAEWWVEHVPLEWEERGRPFDRRLLDAAVHALESLAPTQGEQVLLNQDLHGLNVLAAQREPWLVIDPKPLAGEREFALAPIVRGFAQDRAGVFRWLDRLTTELALDRERARDWAVAQTVAWSLDGEHGERRTAIARWLLEAS